MTVKLDVKVHARSLAKLMAMAEECLTKPGGSIHSQRLTDYISNEFARLTVDQCLEILAEIDNNFEKNLLRDGYGEIIGYAYSKRLFVILRRDPQIPSQNEFTKVAKKLKTVRK